MSTMIVPGSAVAISDAFPDVSMPAAVEQMDPSYLAAIDELCRVKGLARIAHCVEFTAATFGKTFAQVVIDAAEQAAAAGEVFGR